MAASPTITKGRLKATQRQLAELYSVPLKTLAGWKKKGVDIESPIDVAYFVFRSKQKPKSWNRSTDGPEPQEPTREEKLKQEIRKLTAEADKAEKFLEMLEGGMVPREEVAIQQARIAHVCNALIRSIPAELSPLVAGLTPAKVEKVAKEWAATWATKLADANAAVWVEAEKAVQRELRGDLKKVAAAQARKKK